MPIVSDTHIFEQKIHVRVIGEPVLVGDQRVHVVQLFASRNSRRPGCSRRAKEKRKLIGKLLNAFAWIHLAILSAHHQKISTQVTANLMNLFFDLLFLNFEPYPCLVIHLSNKLITAMCEGCLCEGEGKLQRECWVVWIGTTLVSPVELNWHLTSCLNSEMLTAFSLFKTNTSHSRKFLNDASAVPQSFSKILEADSNINWFQANQSSDSLVISNH